MSKRKQVSAEEKRIRMLNLFHEKKEFYQLKVNKHICIIINDSIMKNKYLILHEQYILDVGNKISSTSLYNNLKPDVICDFKILLLTSKIEKNEQEQMYIFRTLILLLI